MKRRPTKRHPRRKRRHTLHHLCQVVCPSGRCHSDNGCLQVSKFTPRIMIFKSLSSILRTPVQKTKITTHACDNAPIIIQFPNRPNTPHSIKTAGISGVLIVPFRAVSLPVRSENRPPPPHLYSGGADCPGSPDFPLANRLYLRRYISQSDLSGNKYICRRNIWCSLAPGAAKSIYSRI